MILQETVRMKQRKPDKFITEDLIRGLSLFFTVGATVVLSILIPTGIGWWLDQPGQFNTHPLYTLIGITFGTVLAGYGLFRLLRRFQIEQSKRYERGKNTDE
jgi:F0F1-type ATP synthase assembly protein I